MPFGRMDLTQVMGTGSHVGEVRQGPDGQLYEWQQGVDGLGNPIGFWKKAFKAVGKFARGALLRLIPAPIKIAARSVCNTIQQLGPTVQQIPPAAPYYKAASGFCRVLRGAGIAGMGQEAIPEAARQAAASIPAQVKGVARKVCGFVDKLGPIARFIPPVAPHYQGFSKLCKVLRHVGVAGIGDGIMEGPDGQLYEVVEGVGEPGRAPRRRVWVNIPAVIRPRGARKMMKPAIPAPVRKPQPLVRVVRANPVRSGAAGIGIMEGPDGQLYEVVEGIGEAARAPRRRVWVSIPAVIRPRGARQVMKRVIPAPGVVSTAQQVVPVMPATPVRPVAPAPAAIPVRRFR
jgi:hypothetical protein